MTPATSSIRRVLATFFVFTLLAGCSGPPETTPPQPPSSPPASEASSTPAEPVPTSSNDVAVLAGSMVPGRMDGDALDAQFIKPYGICAGIDGGLLVADSYGNQIRKIRDGVVTTLAGMANAADGTGFPPGGYRNGAAAEALLNRPRFLDVSADGVVVFSDSSNNMIRTCADGRVYVLAGAPESGYRDGDVRVARFSLPSGVAIDGDGSVYVADTLNHCIRVITPDGFVSTLTGKADQPGMADGPLSQALFNEPNDLGLGPDGSLYIVDKGNQRIRRIYDGQVTTVAGGGDAVDKTTGYVLGGYVDGPAASARFLYPTGLHVCKDGGVYIADTGNNCIRKLENGMVSTVAGSRSAGNRSGNPKEARFNQPLDVVCVDGTLYVTDSYNHVVKCFLENGAGQKEGESS